MKDAYPPSRALQRKQKARRLKGTLKGKWYDLKNMTWYTCIVCASTSVLLLGLILLWIAAGFFLSSHKADLEPYHPDGFYGPKMYVPYDINKCVGIKCV